MSADGFPCADGGHLPEAPPIPSRPPVERRSRDAAVDQVCQRSFESPPGEII